jgi:hypothetical protein
MITDSKIVEAMSEYGGSFAKALAEAWRRADPDNRQRIKNTWPEYWARYVEGVKPMTGVKKVSVQSGQDRYTVRRVDVGDHYGREFCLTYEKEEGYLADDPMIEFYLQDCKACSYDFVGSAEDAIAAGAEPLGWFVSRYYASTLLNRKPGNGLCLHGGSQYDPSRNISAEALNEALEALGFPTSNHE